MVLKNEKFENPDDVVVDGRVDVVLGGSVVDVDDSEDVKLGEFVVEEWDSGDWDEEPATGAIEDVCTAGVADDVAIGPAEEVFTSGAADDVAIGTVTVVLTSGAVDDFKASVCPHGYSPILSLHSTFGIERVGRGEMVGLVLQLTSTQHFRI
ncbi:unnamed protein product [Caenorhabditis nigoni]